MLKAERNEDRSDSVDNKPVASLEFRDSRFPGYHGTPNGVSPMFAQDYIVMANKQ